MNRKHAATDGGGNSMFICPLIAALALAVAPVSQAATSTWDAGGDGTTWSAAQPNNWTGVPDNTVPGVQDTANVTLPSAGAQTILYNTALYSSAAVGPRTVTIGNTGGGITTLTVSQDFYTYVSNNSGLNAVNLTSGGVWKQTGGLARHNDAVLVDGGRLVVEGGTFFGSAWPSGNGIRVGNGGTIEVTGGTFTDNWTLAVGYAGSGSFTLGAGTTGVSIRTLNLGNSLTGTGTVNWNMTATAAGGALQIQVDNGVFNLNAGAGQLFLNSDGRDNKLQIGVGTGTAVFNKNNSANLGGDAATGNFRLLWVGTNGTMNWADGGMLSNQSDQTALNQGTFNFTDTTGTDPFPLTNLNNAGTFNWTGGAALNLNPGNAQGNGDFQNGGRLVLGSATQRTLQGDLILSSSGTLAVTLGSGATGLLATGTNGSHITIDGTLEISNFDALPVFTNYDILTTTLNGGITYNSLILPWSGGKTAVLIDNGMIDKTFTIQIIPEPTSLALLALAGAGLLSRRRRVRAA